MIISLAGRPGRSYLYEGSPARGEALLKSQSYDVSRSSMSGFVKVAREHAIASAFPPGLL